MLCDSARSTSPRRASAEYLAPVGLFGSMTTSARVFGVISAADVVEIGLPAARRIRAIEDRLRSDFREHRGVKRIRRDRNEDLVAWPRERRQRKLDPFGRAGRDHHAIGRHRHAALNALRRDRLTRREDAHRRRVAVVSVPQGPLDRLNHVRRRLEPEFDRIADIEVPDFPPGGFDLVRFRDDVPDGIHEAARRGGNRDDGGGVGTPSPRILPRRATAGCQQTESPTVRVARFRR